jgi:endonuclease III
MPARTRQAKKPLDIDVMLDRIREAVRPFPKAALFELAEDGFDSPFEILVACIVSIRTRDETTIRVARHLFALARTPRAVAALRPEQIDERIRLCTFHEPKARQIHEIARRTVEEFGGRLPCDFDTLTSFRGVGPKCANLTLGIACGQSTGVGVDIHVHRVTNRWGYVSARSPEQTMAVLHEVLPEEHRVQINALLVPFGKHICTGLRPKCSTCPVLDRCRQVGVVDPR